MSEPFLSEIRVLSFGFAPRGWALCNGQILPINQNQALFSLLGTTFGGDGRTNFALPDLRGRVPIHEGAGHTLGERAGEPTHALSVAELPAHTHPVKASNDPAAFDDPAGQYVAAASGGGRFTSGAPTGTLHPSVVSSVGGSQPHENQQPYLVLSFVIALQGIYPSPN
jgi:microcystin-dependent protein